MDRAQITSAQMSHAHFDKRKRVERPEWNAQMHKRKSRHAFGATLGRKKFWKFFHVPWGGGKAYMTQKFNIMNFY